MKKLKLNTKVISDLSAAEQAQVNGGVAAPVTTSFSNCTHFLCCGPGCEATAVDCETNQATDCVSVSCDTNTCISFELCSFPDCS